MADPFDRLQAALPGPDILGMLYLSEPFFGDLYDRLVVWHREHGTRASEIEGIAMCTARAALWLAEGYDHAEVACRLGCSVKKVERCVATLKVLHGPGLAVAA